MFCVAFLFLLWFNAGFAWVFCFCCCPHWSSQSWKLLPKPDFLVILFIWFVWVVQLRIRYHGEMIKQCVHDVCVCVSTVDWYGHRNPQSIGWRTPRGCYDAWITAVIKREDWEREWGTPVQSDVQAVSTERLLSTSAAGLSGLSVLAVLLCR